MEKSTETNEREKWSVKIWEIGNKKSDRQE